MCPQELQFPVNPSRTLQAAMTTPAPSDPRDPLIPRVTPQTLYGPPDHPQFPKPPTPL